MKEYVTILTVICILSMFLNFYLTTKLGKVLGKLHALEEKYVEIQKLYYNLI